VFPDEKGIETRACVSWSKSPNGWKVFPDEKGIETWASGTWGIRGRRNGWKVFPDEKGIETQFFRQLVFGIPDRWKVFPDEKGIETSVTHCLQAGSYSWKVFPDEKGIETACSTSPHHSKQSLESVPR